MDFDVELKDCTSRQRKMDVFSWGTLSGLWLTKARWNA